MNRFVLALAAVALLSVTAKTEASHFRGGAMVPTISSSGVLTVTMTTFWRKGTAGSVTPTLSGAVSGSMSLSSSSLNTLDSRFDVLTDTWTRSIGATTGTIDILATSCCRVAVGSPSSQFNWVESTWDLNSRIVRTGATTAENPIAFNFASVQPEVNRNGSYSDNLGAVSPDGLTLTYNQALNLNITAQAPGFSINTTTGQLTIVAGPGGAASYLDNNNSNSVGADKAFSGNIIASDGSFVEFDWFFDGVNGVANTAPTVQDASTTATVGDVVSHTFTATDAEQAANTLVWSPILTFLGAAPAISPIWNAATQLFTWNTAGSMPGSYVAQVQVQDAGGLTDVGSLNITLNQVQVSAVPEPASLALLAMGAGGLLLTRLRRRRLGEESHDA